MTISRNRKKKQDWNTSKFFYGINLPFWRLTVKNKLFWRLTVNPIETLTYGLIIRMGTCSNPPPPKITCTTLQTLRGMDKLSHSVFMMGTLSSYQTYFHNCTKLENWKTNCFYIVLICTWFTAKNACTTPQTLRRIEKPFHVWFLWWVQVCSAC